MNQREGEILTWAHSIGHRNCVHTRSCNHVWSWVFEHRRKCVRKGSRDMHPHSLCQSNLGERKREI